MKPLFFMIISILLSTQGFSQDMGMEDDCSEYETEEEPCFKYKRPANFENSVIVVPIEREPVMMRPNNYESSFYEQMTR